MNNLVFNDLISVLPNKIQAGKEKTSGYVKAISKYAALNTSNNFKFIQIDHPKFYGTISIDIDNYDTTIEKIIQTVDNFKLPTPNIIVKTTKGFHIHWFLEEKEVIWKNNYKLTLFRKELLNKLIDIFGADKHFSGHIVRNPLLHKYYYFNNKCKLQDFVNIIDINNLEVKRNKHLKINRHIELKPENIKKGNRNNLLLQYIRTFMFKNWGNSKDFYLKELELFNNKLEEPLCILEINTIVNSAFKFVTDKYSVNFTNTKQTIKNRKLAKYKKQKIKNKLKNNLENLLKNDNLNLIYILRFKISALKLSKFLGVSDKTVKKYYKLILKLILDIIKFNFINKYSNFYVYNKYYSSKITFILNIEVLDTS